LIDAREPSLVTSVLESTFSVFPESVSVLLERSKFSTRPVSSFAWLPVDEAVALPVEPLEPEPIDPLEPVEPVEPIDPVEPVEPLDAVLPVDPLEPVDALLSVLLLPVAGGVRRSPVEPAVPLEVEPIEPWRESLVLLLLVSVLLAVLPVPL
jgi:hypothetical protein